MTARHTSREYCINAGFEDLLRFHQPQPSVPLHGQDLRSSSGTIEPDCAGLNGLRKRRWLPARRALAKKAGNAGLLRKA
jgi:hypothetical protein